MTGSDATRDNILNGFDWLQQRIEQDSGDNATAVVYYSGHGWRDTSADPPGYYFIPYDVNRKRLRSSVLRAGDVAEAIRGLRPKRLLVVLDCCHAGGMGVKNLDLGGYVQSAVPAAKFLSGGGGVSPATGAKGLEALQSGHGRAVLTSSQGEELSHIRADDTMSHFTYHLIEALTGHAQPQGGASEVLVSDVLGHVYRRVPESVLRQANQSQRPDFVATGNFPVALLLGGKGLGPGGAAPDPLEPVAASAALAPRGERNISVGQAASGTFVTGDRINSGDDIRIGNISGSSVAIGPGATAITSRGPTSDGSSDDRE